MNVIGKNMMMNRMMHMHMMMWCCIDISYCQKKKT